MLSQSLGASQAVTTCQPLTNLCDITFQDQTKNKQEVTKET